MKSLAVLYEDNHLLVVNKPAGLATMGATSGTTTAVTLAAAYLKGADLTVSVDLGAGAATSTVWTCDLSAEYVRINADYRT